MALEVTKWTSSVIHFICWDPSCRPYFLPVLPSMMARVLLPSGKWIPPRKRRNKQKSQVVGKEVSAEILVLFTAVLFTRKVRFEPNVQKKCFNK
mmetsp:Transcript_38337/g.60734  ORF Transcript_38337/g.60734 Transcript_38337/m.60734 type:complete len:94 (+) Transcript_38337:191-472(+)